MNQSKGNSRYGNKHKSKSLGRFHVLIVGVGGLYLFFAVLVYWSATHPPKTLDKAYLIDVNELLNRLKTLDLTSAPPDEAALSRALSTEGMTYAQEAFWVERTISQEEQLTTLFQNPLGLLHHIEPVIEEGEWVGYLCVYYQQLQQPNGSWLIVCVGLICMGSATILLLLYIRKHFIIAFHRFQSLPMELAKGRLDVEIPESKSRYFGKFAWALSMLRDTLRSAKKNELRLEKEKKMMVLSISHDIKTPVNTIRLYAQAITDGLYQTEEIRTAAERIYAHTVEIETFVAAIREASTQDLLPDAIPLSDFYFHDLIAAIEAYFTPKCELLGISLTIHPFENTLVRGNLDYALRAVENIMENAYKYGDGGWIEISIFEEENYRLLQIKNSGDAVREEEVPHLFESFFRGQNAHLRHEQDGSGLGLYIAREILRKMQGEAYAQREADGMSFVLVFRV
ncbi:MAG: HAMP domain-containing histidine kinase [Lachnospiraceae bacterium]|jgi:signal transduction histidine kinase|nr:HAMP domain-containing histidine kinase [Lachnospiraceae bacterium]